MAASPKKTAVSVDDMSDDEKLKFFTEFESVPENSRTGWINSHGYSNASRFYFKRQQFLKTHPDFVFGPISLDRQRRAEKRLQTVARQRKAGQAAHAREALAAKRAAEPKTNRSARMAPAVKLQAPDDTQAYVDEYLSLKGRNAKSAWLIEHGLNHQNIYEAKARGRSLYAVAKFKPKLSQSLVPASNFHAQILPAPPQRIPSLDEAINAMEIERDQLNAFIERLKRFRNTR